MLGVRRVRLREAYLRVQHSANVEMAAGTDPYMRMRTPDDSIRYQSTIYALVRLLDKVVLCARTVRRLPAQLVLISHLHLHVQALCMAAYAKPVCWGCVEVHLPKLRKLFEGGTPCERHRVVPWTPAEGGGSVMQINPWS